MATIGPSDIIENDEVDEYLYEQNVTETIYENIWELGAYRNIKFETKKLSGPEFGQKMTLDKFIEIKGERTHPSGKKYLSIIILFGPNAEASQKLPNFRKLLAKVLKPYKTYDNIQLMIITPKGQTKTIEKEMTDNSDYPGLYFEYFTYENFIIVVPKAQTCPEMSILTPEEVNEFTNRYHTRKEYLPRISAKDAQALWIGVIPGDVVKITRNSDISGKAIVYRVVV